MPKAEADILADFGLRGADQLHGGMEAKVYALDSARVLKLYGPTTPAADLLRLQAFYNALDRTAVDFALPFIERVVAYEDATAVVERCMPGMTMQRYLDGMERVEIPSVFPTYLTAVEQLARLPVPTMLPPALYGMAGVDRSATTDWHRYLAAVLDARVAETAGHLPHDVVDFPQKLARVQASLAHPYAGSVHIIHGDFFPGNLLVDDGGQVTGLLDFGLFTMAGDPLFDLATAWVFFDMYDERRANLRAQLFDAIHDRHGTQVRSSLHRYVLIYSLLSANLYAPDCSDGHYHWCVDNLNNPAYWQAWR